MIAVLGAGAFGTAMAIALARSHDVALVARSGAEGMARSRQSVGKLPGLRLPDRLWPVKVLPMGNFPVLVAVPTQHLRTALEGNADALAGRPVVALCKGIERGTLAGPTAVIADAVPDARPAILSGPSFAADIARGLPTALTLASREDAGGLRDALSAPTVRLYSTDDVTGVELGGALKNVTAIACGAAVGAGLGESARAALLTRGFAETTRLAVALGADPATLTGLSGLGDLALTCGSDLSRNLRHGIALGRGETPEGGVTVEGALTAQAALEVARREGVEMPIAATVAALVAGETDVPGALRALLGRPLKEE
ncbi:glycerol-3-phosphate dehydrogenase (NAD(P)+) [Hasllibacter halocynthiae]|uniref:Glycerol-3-phosphate dehydrogenase [NAD(P)+] n=1 Tax=Hasllibacter halocynthiae TaxID=595589 RepID=A0A2T0X2L7_9RHOB|nr:NAD(P)H-dependent glycerol-3-phosphate dehydrogenase [Hasllibacter halocynthiae]PRY93181.1 glycerol-3-phosphate dehydrogenase (NAD(P)+) [Hasllibacter halocynthiae]